MSFSDPLKGFKFRVEIDGVDQWAIQKVTMPEEGFEVTEHGGGDYKEKTAGITTIGDATMEKLKPLLGSDIWTHEWMNIIRVSPPSAYKRNIIIKELGRDGISTVNTWVWEGAFPNLSSQSDLDRMSSDNIIETVTFSVRRIAKF